MTLRSPATRLRAPVLLKAGGMRVAHAWEIKNITKRINGGRGSLFTALPSHAGRADRSLVCLLAHVSRRHLQAPLGLRLGKTWSECETGVLVAGWTTKLATEGGL